jgi:hypothetical protein
MHALNLASPLMQQGDAGSPIPGHQQGDQPDWEGAPSPGERAGEDEPMTQAFIAFPPLEQLQDSPQTAPPQTAPPQAAPPRETGFPDFVCPAFGRSSDPAGPLLRDDPDPQAGCFSMLEDLWTAPCVGQKRKRGSEGCALQPRKLWKNSWPRAFCRSYTRQHGQIRQRRLQRSTPRIRGNTRVKKCRTLPGEHGGIEPRTQDCQACTQPEAYGRGPLARGATSSVDGCFKNPRRKARRWSPPEFVSLGAPQPVFQGPIKDRVELGTPRHHGRHLRPCRRPRRASTTRAGPLAAAAPTASPKGCEPPDTGFRRRDRLPRPSSWQRRKAAAATANPRQTPGASTDGLPTPGDPQGGTTCSSRGHCTARVAEEGASHRVPTPTPARGSAEGLHQRAGDNEHAPEGDRRVHVGRGGAEEVQGREEGGTARDRAGLPEQEPSRGRVKGPEVLSRQSLFYCAGFSRSPGLPASRAVPYL